MKTFYVDHNILIKEDEWESLKKLSSPKGPLRLVASDWNIIEIAQAGDKTQAIKRAQFLDAIKPLWAVRHTLIQEWEIKDFLYKNYFKTETVGFTPVYDYLSQMYFHDFGKDVPIGCSVEKIVSAYQADSKILAPIIEQKKASQESLKLIQSKDKRELKEKNWEIFNAWISLKIPTVGPDKKEIPNEQKEHIIKFCFDNYRDLMNECRAIAIEDILFDIRRADAHRAPEEQDAIDLQHAVLALSYCDFFITRDGYVANCAEQVSKKYNAAKIYRNLGDFIKGAI